MSDFNPMLAAEAELGKIIYPKIALVKHNGVRGCNQNGNMLARSKKAIPNAHVHAVLATPTPEDFDGAEGELVVGPWNAPDVFTASTSGIMSEDGEPDFVWYMFDWFHPTKNFTERLHHLETVIVPRAQALGLFKYVRMCEYRWVSNDAELKEYADWAVEQGYEGLVLRDPGGLYKQGRSTQTEQGFMRFCPWLRSEAEILSIEEGKVNNNVSKVNELGYLKKSTHKANMVGSGRAGSATVRDLKTGQVFSMLIPTVALQDLIWKNRAAWIGKIVKYTYKPPVKPGGKPRFPQWEGLRHADDMGS